MQYSLVTEVLQGDTHKWFEGTKQSCIGQTNNTYRVSDSKKN